MQKRSTRSEPIKATRSSGNVFADIGFDEIEAAELAAKADLVAHLAKAIRQRALTQARAARLCGTDQPTLSKVLHGRMGSITIDRLTRWLVAVGSRVRIHVSAPNPSAKGAMSVAATQRGGADQRPL